MEASDTPARGLSSRDSPTGQTAGKEYRVFGPPGTGKTTYLATQIARAVEKHGAENVLVVSFTKAAAVELAGRELPIPENHVGTLHSICYRAMGHPPIAEKGKMREAWNQWLVDRAARGEAAGEDPFQAEGFFLPVGGGRGRSIDDPWGVEEDEDEESAAHLLGTTQTLRNQMVPRDHWITGGYQRLLLFDALWREFKAETGSVDFTDMIERVYLEHDGVPFSPTVLFLDEAQDCSKLELALIRKWRDLIDHIVLALDDDQAIYNFRGASPEALLDHPIPSEHKFYRRQSYRLPRAVAALAGEWIAQVEAREPKEFAPRDADGSVESLPATYGRPEALVDEVEAALAAGKTFMILASCRYMLTSVISELKARAIPYHNPYRKERREWNPLGTHAAGRVAEYCRPAAEVWGDRARPWTWGELESWLEVVSVEKAGLARGAKKNVGRMAVESAAMLVDDGDLRLIFGERVAEWTRGDLALLAASAVNAKARSAISFPSEVLRRRGLAGLLDKPKTVVGTIHSCKGGEADWVSLFPDISGSALIDMRNCGKPAEEAMVRAFYVGITRARERLLVCLPLNPGLSVPIMRYL